MKKNYSGIKKSKDTAYDSLQLDFVEASFKP